MKVLTPPQRFSNSAGGSRRSLATGLLFLLGVTASTSPGVAGAASDDVVCVGENSRYEVRDDGEEARLQVREQYAINRLGTRSDQLRNLSLPNSFPYEPHKARVRVWNANGLRLRYDQNFFQDIAAWSGLFVTDSRLLYLNIDPFEPGDTLEVSYELRIHPFIGFPVRAFAAGGLRTLESTYEVDLPASLEPRYREWNGLGEPVAERHGERIRWTWTVRDLEPYDREPLGPPAQDVLPTVSIGVNRIAWGPSDTWETLGHTYWERARERVEAIPITTLPARRHSGSSPLQLALERIQNNVRYVAIELRDGGWIPHPSPETLRRKYGDCKDMSAILLSVLNGEDQDGSLAAVATRGSCGFKVDPLPTLLFFNHMVVCAGADPAHPVWLDATDTYGTEQNPRWDIQGAQALVVSGPAAGLRRIEVGDPSRSCSVHTLELKEYAPGRWTAVVRAAWTGFPAQQVQHELDHDETPLDLARQLTEPLLCRPRSDLVEEDIRLTVTAPDTVSMEFSFPAASPFDASGRTLPPAWERDPYPLRIFADAGRKTDVYWPMVGVRTDSLIIEPLSTPPAPLPDSTWTVEIRDLTCTVSQRSTARSVCLVRTCTIGSLVYPVADWEAGRDARRRVLRWSTRNLAGTS